MIKAIIFDLDDTLYREMDFVEGGFKKVSEYLSNKNNLECDMIFERLKGILYKSGRGKIFDILCNEFDIDEDISKIIEVYRGYNDSMCIYEDSQYILDKLKGKYKLGIITDGLASVQNNKINSLGIRGLFNHIIVSDELGREYWKPNKRPYLEICKKLNVYTHKTIYIGDNPHKDFITAKRLGMKTIRIIRSEGDHVSKILSEEFEAHYTISDFYELEKILESL